jgi:hypothetical protein
VRNLHEEKRHVEAEYRERMIELQCDVEKKDADMRDFAMEKEQQELALRKQLAVEIAREKEYGEYFQ